MEKSMLTEVKAILKSLVLSSPDNVTIEKLNRDYRDIEGQYIPHRQLGYGNLEEFLSSMPDTLRVFGNGPTASVCFVPNEKSDHIHDMIMKQKKPKTKPKSNSNRIHNNKSQQLLICKRWNTQAHPPVKKLGQQLSPYQSVSRNVLTKTLQVRDAPNVQMNYRLQPIQTYDSPNPNGVKNPQECFYYTQNSIKNGVIKPVCNDMQKYKTQINEVSNLLRKQHIVSKPPPPLPRDKTSLDKPIEAAVLGKETIEKKNLNKHTSDNKKCHAFNETENLICPSGVNTSRTTRQISSKLSDEAEDLLTMPNLRKVTNPIQESILNKQENYSQNANSFNQVALPASKRFFDDSSDEADDLDEAVPLFAAKNNVFQLDFPEYAVGYGNKIKAFEIPEDIVVGSCIKIFISEIHNPFKFWFHIHKDNHELDLLMFQIERYYMTLDSEDMCIPTTCLVPGQVCAACYNGLWHRAKIVGPPVNNKIKVSFMDYGTVSEVEIKSIKFLASHFANLPAQAVRGSLSNIKPRALHWSHDATTYFLSLVAELMLYAKIIEIDREKNIFYMVLCDTNGDEVIQINRALVEQRYASYDEEWKSEKIKQNNGKRIHHPREDFPTFSMIESGEYPSFPQLVVLRQLGIDYETIYDLIIFNQSTILNKHESASERLRNLPYFLTTSNPFRTEILLELYATASTTI